MSSISSSVSSDASFGDASSPFCGVVGGLLLDGDCRHLRFLESDGGVSVWVSLDRASLAGWRIHDISFLYRNE